VPKLITGGPLPLPRRVGRSWQRPVLSWGRSSRRRSLGRCHAVTSPFFGPREAMIAARASPYNAIRVASADRLPFKGMCLSRWKTRGVGIDPKNAQAGRLRTLRNAGPSATFQFVLRSYQGTRPDRECFDGQKRRSHSTKGVTESQKGAERRPW
jgi:hypothetical protein